MCLGSILELGIGDIGEGVKAADMMVQFEVSGGDCRGHNWCSWILSVVRCCQR